MGGKKRKLTVLYYLTPDVLRKRRIIIISTDFTDIMACTYVRGGGSNSYWWKSLLLCFSIEHGIDSEGFF